MPLFIKFYQKPAIVKPYTRPKISLMKQHNDKINVKTQTLYLLLCGILFGLHAPLIAQNVPVFEAGQTVCFVGDSITHSDHHLRLIRYFYQSRFPDKPVTIENCGISGDSLGNVLARFDADIAVKKPSYVVVMMGMNDVQRHLYAKEDDAALASRTRAINTFKAKLSLLCDQLQALPVKHIVLMSPSIYDEYTTNPKASPAIKGLNEQGLKAIQEIVKTMAKSRGLGYVPMYEKTLEATLKKQTRTPNVSLNNPDRIHPNTSGAYVMAAAFLTSQQLSPICSSTNVNYSTSSLLSSQQTDMTDITRLKDQSLQGNWTLKRLPMLMDGYVRAEDTDYLQDMNQVLLQVADLPEHSQWKLLLNNKCMAHILLKF